MGSPFIDFNNPLPTFGIASADPFFSQDATFVITNGQLTVNKPLFVFPVATVPDALTPLPPMYETETKLVAFAHYLRTLADRLADLMARSRKATEEMAGAVASMQTLAGLAGLLYRRVAMATKSPAVVAKVMKLAEAAEKLADKAATKFGKDAPNAENVVPDIRDKVHLCYAEIENALRNPELIALWDTYHKDKTVPDERKQQFVREFKEVTVYVTEIMMRSPDHKGVTAMALEAFNDTKSTVFGKELDISAKLGAVVGNMVGNLPGPDALAMTLAKCYATFYLPTAAVSQAEARALESVLTRMFVSAMNFTKDNAGKFRSYHCNVADAQKKVADAEKSLLALRRAAQTSAEKLTAAETALLEAQGNAQKQSNYLRNFLIDAPKGGGKPEYTKFDRFQAGTAISAALTVMSFIQLLDAFIDLGEEDKPALL